MAKAVAAPKRGGLGAAVKRGKAEAAEPRTRRAAKSEDDAGEGGKAGWFGVGWGSAKAAVQKADKDYEDQKNTPRRYWIPADDKNHRIIFVDGEPFTLREHEFAINGDFKNKKYKTCLAVSGKACPFCAADNKASYVGFFTVIDLSKYEGRDKKIYKNQIRLFAAKSQSLKMLGKLAEKLKGDLSGVLMDVSRSGPKSPGCGDGFIIDKRLNLKAADVLKKLEYKAAPKALDYDAIAAPMDQKEAREWMNNLANAPQQQGPRGKNKSEEGDDDEIPF